MADLLIRHLQKKGQEHSALNLLVNQWGFDEKLIPKALQTVGNLFTHYSRHDESHSKQILVNIERLLGGNIDLLTATDTWLLLEAAYWHDIGMVVPHRDIEDALSNPAFHEFLSSIQGTPSHELCSFAKSFDPKKFSITNFHAETSPLVWVNSFKQLMSEWFRRKHPERAEHIVQSPFESIGVDSPRTELIPARLFRLLGRVCHMHGRPFSDILSSTGLPFKEAGLAQENCHPRFVACLLRIGDLLDLDDNRFCPVMQRIAGDERPLLTYAHEDKHAGVRHLRVDQERIEISAECKTIEGYLETFKWFDWLKQEVQDQMAHWQDIAPSRDLGLLPMLGSISVSLSGELQVLAEGERPQFSLDKDKAVQLLQGTNLYEDRFSCIRELLQNATDATLLRLWGTEQLQHAQLALSNPYSADSRALLEKYPILVDLKELPGPGEESSDSYWLLTIRDKGTGISRQDLEFMLQIGGSQRNQCRQDLIAQMPEWMKPSGMFGIGFQSVFIVCDEVTLVTKSIFTHEILRVQMHNPTGPKEGLVLLKVCPPDVAMPCGTQLEVRLKISKGLVGVPISFGEGAETITQQYLREMDPVLDKPFPYAATQLADQVGKFSIHCPISINASLTLSGEEKRSILDIYGLSEATKSEWSFIEVEGHQLGLRYRILPFGEGQRHHDQLHTYYRGQPFKSDYVVYLRYVDVDIDILSGKAGIWLNASRDSLVSSARKLLRDVVIRALEKRIAHDLENNLIPQEKKPELSLFLEFMSLQYEGRWDEFARVVDREWLSLPIPNSPENTFGDYFEKIEWTIASERRSFYKHQEGSHVDIVLDLDGDMLMAIILNAWLKDSSNSVEVFGSEFVEPSIARLMKRDRSVFGYRLRKNGVSRYTEPALASHLCKATEGLYFNKRYFLPMEDRWSKLFIRKGTVIQAEGLFDIELPGGLVLLPFLFRPNRRGDTAYVECNAQQLASLVNWIQPYLVTSSTHKEIQTCYEDLIAYIDTQLLPNSIYAKHWEVLRKSI